MFVCLNRFLFVFFRWLATLSSFFFIDTVLDFNLLPEIWMKCLDFFFQKKNSFQPFRNSGMFSAFHFIQYARRWNWRIFFCFCFKMFHFIISGIFPLPSYLKFHYRYVFTHGNHFKNKKKISLRLLVNYIKFLLNDNILFIFIPGKENMNDIWILQ